MTKNNSAPIRERRAAEAVERQAQYDAKSTEAKIATAQERPGNSARELKRLGG